MKLRVVVYPSKDGGFWAEVPSLPGCITQGETVEEIRANVREAIIGYLGLDEDFPAPEGGEVFEIAI